MSKGIYGYWDNKKEYVAYIGKDSKIDNPFNRNYYHNAPFNHNAQQINKALQNNPDRYDYFVLVEGDFPEDDLNKMESQAIELFKTFRYDYPEKSVFNFTKGGEGMLGVIPHNKNKKTPTEIRDKISESNTKHYARIVKKGGNRYAIKKGKDLIKTSINPKRLINWFNTTYPGENLEYDVDLLNLDVNISDEFINRSFHIVRNGFCEDKQIFSIKKGSEIYKSSVNINTLKRWFFSEYPLEIIKMELN